MKYYLTIYAQDTDKLIYENAFVSVHSLNEELEQWDLEEYRYEVEEL